ncbi:MAG: hypothetical protein U0R71_10335 [Solirubrobacterales bacterium]
MARKLSTLILLAAALALSPARAAAYLPPGFLGVSPQSAATAKDMTLMRKAGIRSLRISLNWPAIEPDNPEYFLSDWSGFDREVGMAAEAGIEVLPTVWGSPDWVALERTALPVRTAWQRRGWTRFLREAVRRYGPGGEFWDEHPELPYLPIRRWEIWNEENIVSFAGSPEPAEYARLVRISGRAVHAADGGAEVIVGGLFGRPLQVPPNVGLADFLNRLYRAGDVKPFFDAIGLHPYVADARAMRWQLQTMRRIMRRHGDGRTTIYVTELGWGSRSGPTRWERGLYGQARELSRSLAILSANRLRWRIGGAWWFSWRDAPPTGCLFCASSGLLTEDREAKPAWYRFNEWSGGNPDTVPRAKFGN